MTLIGLVSKYVLVDIGLTPKIGLVFQLALTIHIDYLITVDLALAYALHILIFMQIPSQIIVVLHARITMQQIQLIEFANSIVRHYFNIIRDVSNTVQLDIMQMRTAIV
jgi:hypothetical protein